MVIKRTINDWYANAEGRGSSDFRHDWENDDLPDRTPDVWLDRLHSKARATTSPARQRAPRPAPASPNHRSRPRQQELADAARVLEARMRGIKDTTIARHLAQSGWPGVSADQVREALRAYPAQTGKQPAPKGPSAPRRIEPAKKKQQSYGTITIISPPTATRKPADNDTAARVPQSLVEAVRAVQARHPKLGIKRLAKEVRARGWPTATQQQVRAALPARPLPPQPTPSPRGLPAPVSRPAERAPHPDACFACGVVPSLLGMCRCS